MPPAQKYLARYNGYTLPGYVQAESINSSLVIGNHQANYADASLSDYVGLENKQLSLRLKVWECSYDEVRREVRKAATILRTDREGYAPLYVQFSDKYYEAIVQKVASSKEVNTSLKLREYTVDFEAKPWLTHQSTNSIIGSNGVLSTSNRTLSDGGWAPTIVTVTGDNVTISGYTDTRRFTGFMSIEGHVDNLIVDSANQTAFMVSGGSSVDRMLWSDFSMYVGPGTTHFAVAGATNCQIDYQNRWYI